MTRPFTSLRVRPLRIAAYGASGAALLVHFGALAQNAERVTIDARRCTEIESPDERLACFEAEVEAARGAKQPAAATARPAPPTEPETPRAASTPQQPRSSEPPARTVDLTGVREQDARAAEQTAWAGSISSLTQREPNRYLITLTTGETFFQKSAERYPMRVGQRVRVYNSRWGNNQRLQAEGVNGFIQVERVR